MELKLRQWQSEAKQKALDWFKKGQKSFLIEAAPGAGKTIASIALAQSLIKEKLIERVIVAAPTIQVVNQWSRDFQSILGRPMMRVTSSETGVEGYGHDLCFTWQSSEGLIPALQQICLNSSTLLIGDELHHAAVTRAWGDNADIAFKNATFKLALSGTPIRSDGLEPVWFAYNPAGKINQPEDGKYSLDYGKAVDLGYCRPITFHRHEGNFNVVLDEGETIKVNGAHGPIIPQNLKKIKGLDQALEFFKLACTPTFCEDSITPNCESYQASMLEWGIEKLRELRLSMPSAGGLVIAKNVELAEHMAELLEILEGERPVVVHNQIKNPESKISAFRESNKKWLVSVAMISEGVDIPRLRVLVYLPNAKTELSFRQAMGRVVRTSGSEDTSRAYVVMPAHEIFDLYARRVEDEMKRWNVKDKQTKQKTCPVCEEKSSLSAKACGFCGYKWPVNAPSLKACNECEGLNPIGSDFCMHCGSSFKADFKLELKDALRSGAIIRGMDFQEDEVKESEELAQKTRELILRSGDEHLIRFVKQFPIESWSRIKRIMDS